MHECQSAFKTGHLSVSTNAGLVATGSLKGALIGGLTGAAFGYVGDKFGKWGSKLGDWGNKIYDATIKYGINVTKTVFRGAQAVSHGIVGGLSTKLNGGSFSKGILTSFVNKLATPTLKKVTPMF